MRGMEETYHCECPAIVANYSGNRVFENGYPEREGDEGKDYLGDVQPQLEAWDILRVPFELTPAHLYRY